MIIARYDVILDQSERACFYNQIITWTIILKSNSINLDSSVIGSEIQYELTQCKGTKENKRAAILGTEMFLSE